MWILDRSANILSRARHLMVMDCKDEGHELVPQAPGVPQFEVAIVHSGISTPLMQTDYNNRVAQCNVAAWILRTVPGVHGARFSGAGYRGCCIGSIDSGNPVRIEQGRAAVPSMR